MRNDYYCALFETSSAYLVHHGIKGQKWGVRRYQNLDRTWTEEGKIRYGNGPGALRSGSQSSESNVRTKTSSLTSKSSSHKPLRQTALSTLKKSKAYFDTYVLGKQEVDTVIKRGTKFSRVQTSNKFENFGAYYATYKKSDVDRYIGLFGKNLRNRAVKAAKQTGDQEQIKQAKNMNVYQLKLRAAKNIKVASNQHASDVANNLTKDAKFKENLLKSIDHTSKDMKRPQQQRVFRDAKRALNKDPARRTEKDRSAIYKALNLTLTNHEQYENDVQSKFYSAMKKKGYGAIVDLNDQSYSSYHAKKPMIVFANKSSTKVDSVRTLSDKEMNRKYAVHNTMRMVHEAAIAVPETLRDAGYVSLGKVRDRANSDYSRTGRDYVNNGSSDDEKKKRK